MSLKCASCAHTILQFSFRAICQRKVLLAGWLRPLVSIDAILIPIVDCGCAGCRCTHGWLLTLERRNAGFLTGDLDINILVVELHSDCGASCRLKGRKTCEQTEKNKHKGK